LSIEYFDIEYFEIIFRDSGALNELEKTHLTEIMINLDPYKLNKLIEAKQRSILRKLR